MISTSVPLIFSCRNISHHSLGRSLSLSSNRSNFLCTESLPDISVDERWIYERNSSRLECLTQSCQNLRCLDHLKAPVNKEFSATISAFRGGRTLRRTNFPSHSSDKTMVEAFPDNLWMGWKLHMKTWSPGSRHNHLSRRRWMKNVAQRFCLAHDLVQQTIKAFCSRYCAAGNVRL